MVSNVKHRALVGIAAVALVITGPEERAHSQSREILLDPAIECWYSDEFPVVGAVIQPEGAPSSVRLYYRCSAFADYYFLGFASSDRVDRYEAVAPMAEESCPSVYYYVESIDADFSALRTAERSVDVTTTDRCRDRNPDAAWWTGDDPRIVVRPVRQGAPLLAPGFQSVGISTQPAGGIPAGVAIAAAAGAAAGLAVLVSGGGDEAASMTSTSIVGGATTSTIASTTTTTGAPSPSPSSTSSTTPPTTTAGTTTSTPTSSTTSSTTSTSTTSTPTTTVPRGTPNVTLVDLGFPSPASSGCPRGTFREATDLTIANTGNDVSGAFRIRFEWFSNPSKVNFLAVSPLKAGERRTLNNVQSPCGGSCFIPGCTVCVELDPDGTSGETNRSDNTGCKTTIG